MQRGREAERLRVSQSGGDLRIATHEGAVVAPCLPRRHFGVHQRAPGDFKPVLHALGDQVRGDLGAGSHVQNAKNLWAARAILSCLGTLHSPLDAFAENKGISISPPAKLSYLPSAFDSH